MPPPQQLKKKLNEYSSAAIIAENPGVNADCTNLVPGEVRIFSHRF
jgi:hypothetical protein